MELQQFRFTVEGVAGNLECHAYDPGNRRLGMAVVAHPHPLHGGTMDNKVANVLARALAEAGYLAVRFNFRGVGLSEGVHDEGNGETEDLLGIVEFLREEFGQYPMALAGFSFGAYVAARAAQKINPQKLILVGAAVGRFAMPQVSAGTLIVHGEMDEIIALSELFAWAREQQHPVVVFPGAGHFFHGRLAQLKQVVIDYCKE